MNKVQGFSSAWLDLCIAMERVSNAFRKLDKAFTESCRRQEVLRRQQREIAERDWDRLKNARMKVRGEGVDD
jgi:hypothetical protein